MLALAPIPLARFPPEPDSWWPDSWWLKAVAASSDATDGKSAMLAGAGTEYTRRKASPMRENRFSSHPRDNIANAFALAASLIRAAWIWTSKSFGWKREIAPPTPDRVAEPCMWIPAMAS